MQQSTPWGIREILIALVTAILAVFAVLGSLILIRNVLATQQLPSLDIRVASLIGTMVYQFAFFGIAVAAARISGGSFRDLGFRAFPPIWAAIAVFLLSAGFTVIIVYGLLLRVTGLGTENVQNLDQIVGSSPFSLFLAVLAAGVVAPLAEETLFRGLVLNGLMKRLGLYGAVLVSSAVFAAAHLQPQLYVPTFILGIFLSILRIGSGSLWPGIGLHAAFNTVQLLLVYAAIQSGAIPR